MQFFPDRCYGKIKKMLILLRPRAGIGGGDSLLEMNDGRGVVRVRVPAWKSIVHRCIMVEAAGVEPASENVTGQETTCLVQFMPWALPQDVRGRRSERTRNASR